MADIPRPTGLDWVQLKKDMDQISTNRTPWERILHKCQANPLVPIGATATTCALVYGIISFYKGKVQMSQRMMRVRVGAQLFTVLAAVGGVFFALPKEKRNIQGLIESGDPEKRAAS